MKMMTAVLASKYSISGPFLSMTSNVEKEKKKHSISSKKTIPLALSQNALVSVSATGGTVMNNQTMTLASNSVTVIIALVSCAFAGDIIEKKTKVPPLMFYPILSFYQKVVLSKILMILIEYL